MRVRLDLFRLWFAERGADLSIQRLLAERDLQRELFNWIWIAKLREWIKC